MPGYMKDLENGKFQFEVSHGHDGSGKRRKAYRTIQAKGKTPEAQLKYAEKQLALFVAAVEKGEYQSPTNYTFASYAEEWRKNAELKVKRKALAPKTLYRYCEMLRLHILPHIGAYKLEEINSSILENAYDELREPQKRERILKDGTKKIKEYTLSEQTLKHIHRLIGTILQTAFRKGIINDNPISRTEAPKPQKHEVQAYDNETIATLIDVLENTDIQFKAAVHTTLAAGCRLGELMGLEWTDVDYESKTITIRQASQYLPGIGTFTKDPKNDTSKRSISMPAPVMDIITQLEHEQKVQKVKLGNKWKGAGSVDENGNDRKVPDRLFTQADGSPMFPYTISKQWKVFREEKGLPELTFHGLRHTSASYLIACGQDVVSVAKRLGHSNSNTTLSIYAHAFKKRDEEAARHMEGLYAKKESVKDCK
jgi:integrase